MAENDLINVLNDSIDRLASGQTIDDCLRYHPQHAPQLRVMLETGRLVQRARVNPLETAQAQERVRVRMLQAWNTPVPRASYPLRSLLGLAASLVIVFIVTIGGVAASRDSLPGDALYSFKRLSESIEIVFGADPAAFEDRRRDEIRQVLAQRRAVDVDFSGELLAASGEDWVVGELPLRVLAGVPGADAARLGDKLSVQAYTTTLGGLVARRIEVLEPGNRPPTPAPTLTPTATPTSTASVTPSATPTITATASMTPTFTATATLTASPTVSRTPTPTPSPSATPTPTSAECQRQQPPGWVEYMIMPGDTLSRLAAATGTTVDEITRVNCIRNPRLVVAGQRVYLPSLPSPPAAISPGTGPTSGTQPETPSDGHQNQARSENTNDNDNDDDDDDRGGKDDDDDDNDD